MMRYNLEVLTMSKINYGWENKYHICLDVNDIPTIDPKKIDFVYS
jgi:hypothetical protein